MKVSFFNSSVSPVFRIPSAPPDKQFIPYAAAHIDFYEVVTRIKNCQYQGIIDDIRKADYSQLKRIKLPGFTPAGTFRLRWDTDLLVYTGLVCLDYDKVDSVFHLKEAVERIPYTFCSFFSPSWQGLKVIVKVDTAADYHLLAYEAVKRYYDEKLGLQSDRSCKNLSRLCYFSYDKDIIYRVASDVFPALDYIRKNEASGSNAENAGAIRMEFRSTSPDLSLLASHADTQFGYLYNFTMKNNSGYQNAGRNNFIFVFACNCNRYGISLEKAVEFASLIWNANNEDFTWQEVEKTVRSAYSRNVSEHAKFPMPQFQRVY